MDLSNFGSHYYILYRKKAYMTEKSSITHLLKLMSYYLKSLTYKQLNYN